MPSVLFVCTGNICRSPLAEAALRAACAREGLDILIDSAGTGAWHLGDAPDPRAQAVARQQGLDIAHYQARKVHRNDFSRFTHIIALDRSHLQALRRMNPSDGIAELSLLLDHAPGRRGEDVADPYYGTDRDFERTWAEVQAAMPALMQALHAG